MVSVNISGLFTITKKTKTTKNLHSFTVVTLFHRVTGFLVL